MEVKSNSNWDEFPFIAERIAIELSNTISSSDAGLRGFRNRNLISRVIGGITGKGNELTAQLFANQLIANRAVEDYLQMLSDSELHTQACLIRVTKNLLKTMQGLKNIDEKYTELESHLHLLQSSLQDKLVELENKLKRNEQFDYLKLLFKNKKLYPGFSPILNVALFLAHVEHLYVGEEELYQKSKKEAAIDVAKDYLKNRNQPQTINKLIEDTVRALDREVIEMAFYITSNSNNPVLNSMNNLLLRRLAQLEVNEQHVRESLLTAQIMDADTLLKGGTIFTPLQVSQHIAMLLTSY